ncbi:MAG: molybdopterin-synthase adenylyltransferase MoeB [Meiothermus sp.]|uniref:HesA/MoeB/ThiF family protein n=1 Tax=Meiothermus sp. TaxID=1955249 RepID=UPI0025F68E62|nr:molybdopterin-synthase adenylyltransferase MoeB [Meiothermus sp.]MCS7057534.1 molybdopterin-synthase adenylyltransferase MoeB [Meiothermus sp.]MCS7193723.1 molybdopterin-synthase adenylyltransferase MoeB [Meiothermus sp.]MCX7740010.1 molybdopterin-synthase adenylyltransferase MoeB [Meiothermus sp.]MDW8089922.1 molybdopterin-synthase adenylyltransferase MoeB [Meiothermus sp.]MDW8481653.1 molybdopterin-synthase adenylyltransferase MoeB [Meiothermus sp.]
MWTKEELDRYARHIVLPGVGGAGQARLKESRVLVVGAGGLGAPVLLYLAAAGVGRLGIVEMDRVDLTNLQRQVLFDTPSIGEPKAEVAKARLQGLNPHVRVEVYPTKLSAANALEILEPYHLVIDCSDNFPTRYLVNDACVLLDKPLVYGAIHQFEGQLSVFHHQGGPCYRCLFPSPPPPGAVPSCAEAGVFGVLPGVIGSLMAAEAIKVLIGLGTPLSGRLLLYEALEPRFRVLRLARRADCPVCGENPSVTTLQDYELLCGVSV